jgi:WD40 repeat protein
MQIRIPGFVTVIAVATVGASSAGLVSACATTQPVDADSLGRLRGSAPGTYLSGKPLGLDAPEVVNRRDFAWAIDFDDTSQTLAFVHHVSTDMELTVTGISPLAPVFQEKLNKSEFDNEDVVIDGDRILVPSRQGVLRAVDRATGRLLTEVTLGEPLLRVAVSGDRVFAASADGRVMAFDRSLGFIGESVLHKDEVRGLVALGGNRVMTASMDGTLVISHTAPAERPLVRLPTSALASGDQVFLSHLDGRRAIATIRDARQPSTVISRAAVKRLELPGTDDGQLLTVMTAEGPQELPAVSLGELRLRSLSAGALMAAVCDSCVPAGAELVLGADLLARVSLVEDVAAGELVARPVDGAQGVAMTPGAVMFVVEQTSTLPGPANDLDASHGRALVTFSQDKAERSFDIHDHERKGSFPPPSATSGAALVDVVTGAIGQRYVSQHLGFTVTGALSPDGKTVVTGGWDRRILVWDAETGEVVTERSFAWLVRRVRFSPDGHLLGVAAWTPVNALNEGDSEPSVVLYPVALATATLVTPSTTTPGP